MTCNRNRNRFLPSLILFILALGILTGCTSQFEDEAKATPEPTIEALESTTPMEHPPTPTPDPTPSPVPEDSSFEIRFLDVGEADAALVICDGHAMLIDGGDPSDSSLIYSLLNRLGMEYLDYIVCSHADADHVGGLAGALNYADVGTAFCPTTQHDTRAFESFVKYLENRGKSITVPSAGDTFSLGNATIQIVGPIKRSSEENNNSIILRIVYGETSFLFTGDAEREEEQDVLAAGYDLTSTVLKVGHHGSDSSTGYQWLYEVMPRYGVISVGMGNSYGHPTENTLSRLRDADVQVFRTDLQGDIICTSDGKNVSFTVQKNPDADTLAPQSTPVPDPTPEYVAPDSNADRGVTTTYILNTNTGKFHIPSCSSVNRMNENNKQAFTGTRDEAIALGYSPCGRCHP